MVENKNDWNSFCKNIPKENKELYPIAAVVLPVPVEEKEAHDLPVLVVRQEIHQRELLVKEDSKYKQMMLL